MVVFAVHLSVNALSAWATGRPPAEHPTMDFVRTRAGPTEVVLVLFQVMLAAPVTEELLFRGVVQPWLSARGWAPHALMGLLVAVFVMGAVLDPKTGHPRLPEADDLGPPVLALFLWPAVGLVGRLPEGWLRRVFGRGPLAEGPGGVWRPVPPADVARAVTATAAFFGLAHSAVWPTPVPLFVLGLGLGWLAQRTRHLAAPAAVHSAFNAVSCVLLFLEGKP
jgi:membrane protease YdiL (CAAX protease family)